jgi:hypothetical protein
MKYLPLAARYNWCKGPVRAAARRLRNTALYCVCVCVWYPSRCAMGNLPGLLGRFFSCLYMVLMKQDPWDATDTLTVYLTPEDASDTYEADVFGRNWYTRRRRLGTPLGLPLIDSKIYVIQSCGLQYANSTVLGSSQSNLLLETAFF